MLFVLNPISRPRRLCHFSFSAWKESNGEREQRCEGENLITAYISRDVLVIICCHLRSSFARSFAIHWLSAAARVPERARRRTFLSVSVR